MKKKTLLVLISSSSLSLFACVGNTSSSASSTPTPTVTNSPAPSPNPTIAPSPSPSPTVAPNPTSLLLEFVNKLRYSANLQSTANQFAFTTDSAVSLANVTVSYYQNSANCSSGLNNAVTLNGNVTLPAGTYTSSDASNYSLCSMYPGGCAGLYAAVQGSTAWSMQYTYNFTNGTSYQSDCMVNPSNPIGFAAEFIANYSSGVAACTSGNSCGFSQAYTLPLGWSTQVGAAGGTSYGVGITRDSSGNFIITGNTTVGLSGQTQAGTQDYFIAKYNPSGNLIWTKQAGTNISVYGVASDISSNIYIGGYTYDALSGQTQTGVKDYFIAKYDSDGNLIWNRQVGVAGNYTPSYSISTDVNGNSYLIGTTTAGVSGQAQTGLEDYFIVKYDSDGNLIWTRQVGGGAGGKTRGLGITSDSSGNIYATGYTLIGLSGQTQTGTRDYFIVKYDSDGNLIWTRQVGGTGGTTTGTSISLDGSDVYVAGTTNVGLSGQTQTSTQDCFIAKYDNAGNMIWTRQLGEANTPGYGFIVNNAGNSCVTGYTGQFPSVGNKNYIIVKYDSDGNLIWTKQIGGATGTTAGTSLNLNNGNVYAAGYTSVGISGQTQIGTDDYLIFKIPNQN